MAEFTVYQGTDFELDILLPVEIGAADPCYVTLAQGFRTVLEYQRNGEPPSEATTPTGVLLLVSGDPHVLRLAMTQADTLRLSPGDVKAQVRVRTDAGSLTFRPILGIVGKAIRPGEI